MSNLEFLERKHALLTAHYTLLDHALKELDKVSGSSIRIARLRGSLVVDHERTLVSLRKVARTVGKLTESV